MDLRNSSSCIYLLFVLAIVSEGDGYVMVKGFWKGEVSYTFHTCQGGCKMFPLLNKTKKKECWVRPR